MRHDRAPVNPGGRGGETRGSRHPLDASSRADYNP